MKNRSKGDAAVADYLRQGFSTDIDDRETRSITFKLLYCKLFDKCHCKDEDEKEKTVMKKSKVKLPHITNMSVKKF